MLISLDRTAYRIGDQPRFQARIENVGSSIIEIPVSSSLTDLQPPDPAEEFKYFRMVVELWIGGERWSANTGGKVTLYGNDLHPGTMLALHPGEWVKISGQGKITRPQDFDQLTALRGKVTLSYVRPTIYQDEILLTNTASATSSTRVCLYEVQGQSLPIQLDPN